jgi:hypothetical protein
MARDHRMIAGHQKVKVSVCVNLRQLSFESCSVVKVLSRHRPNT